MSIRGSRDQLTRALQDLLVHWDRTRDTWRDNRARDFERKVLEPLDHHVQHAAKAMDTMAANIQRVRSECSDSTEP